MDYYYVLDFEANCTEINEFRDDEMEIIEFPIIIIDIKKNQVIDEFHRYVKPVKYPALTDFCKSLTNIKQSQMDDADEFKDVMKAADEFISKYTNGKFVTTGNWDLKTALPNQLKLAKLDLRNYSNAEAFGSWINMNPEFKKFYTNRKDDSHLVGSIKKMLYHFNLEFEGRLHSGIDDTRNMARILQKMISDGFLLHE